MRRKSPPDAPSRESLDARAIDELYGLEPVFEPGVGSSELTRFVAVRCPYCGESIETSVDLSAGSFRYVEDCQVCCQPIELAGEVDEDGALVGVTAGRG
ncbi:MAG: CPXCG motif-containing cysteine-rich protein [Steroidobacteraceae bacterium]